MQLSDLTVEVRTVDLVRRGQIEDRYLDCKLEPKYLAPGAWTVKLPNEHPMAPVLAEPGSGIIVTHTDPAVGVLLSGPSLSPVRAADRSDPQGTSVFTGTTDDVLLWRRVAYPTPTTADVSAQVSAYDVRSGVAETIMRAYVNANLGPGAPVERRVAGLTLAADGLRGPLLNYSARFDRLGDLLASLATVAGLGFRVVQVGDHLEFQVYDPTDKSDLIRLDMANGTLVSQSVERSAPTLTRAIVAGQGVGEDRTLLEVAAPAEEADWGIFGRIEGFIDQRNTDDPVELTQAGTEAILEGASGLAVRAVPGDDSTMAYPTDWGLGDVLGLVVDDEEASAQVTGAIILANHSVGVTVGASIGDVQGWDPQAPIRRELKAQDERVSNLERNLESGTSTVVPPNSDLDDLDRAGVWTIDTTALASQTANWPGQGIPTAYTADANNATGSYRPNTPGYLRTIVTPTRVVQEATLVMALSNLPRSLQFRRVRGNSGTWGKWVLVDHILTVATQAAQAAAMKLVNADRTHNVVHLCRSDFTVPYNIMTTDGVQVMRDASGARQGAPGWVTLTWDAGSGVTDYGSGWAAPAVIRTSAGIIKVRGLGTRAAGIPAAGTVLLTLPEGMRPHAKLMFAGPSAGNTTNCRIDVHPDGRVTFQTTGGASMAHIDVSGIQFPAADVAPSSAWTPVTMDAAAGWTSYHLADATWPEAAYWQDSCGRVWFRGLVRRAAGLPGADSRMFTIPSALGPDLQTHGWGTAASGSLFASLHWVRNGAVTDFIFKAGNAAGANSWVSLSSMCVYPVASIPESSWRTMLLQNSWVKYPGASYPGPGVWSAPDGLQHMRGLIASGSIPAALSAAMAVNDRMAPLNVMWSTVANNAMARINYNPGDNTITVTTGSSAWLSLDGPSYFMEA